MSKPSIIMPDVKDLAAHGGIARHLVRRDLSWKEDGIAETDLPRPAGWRLLIEPIQIREQTEGGVILTDIVREAAEYVRAVGLVCAVGPAAYRHRKFMMFDKDSGKDQGSEPWCRPGDWVVFGRYSGQIITMKGAKRDHEFRFVNDDEVLAVAPRPEMLINYVA